MNWYKVKAIFKLGIKDILKNSQTIVLIILPLFFAILYSNMDFGGAMSKEYLLVLCTILNIAMIPVSLMGMIIAEEKEKNTLRTLMLSNVSSTEFLLSKALICFAFMLVTNSIIYFVVGLSVDYYLPYLIISMGVTLAVIFFGAIVGILSKNQMSTGVTSTPLMLIFMMPIFFVGGDTIVSKIFRFVPTSSMIELLEIVMDTKKYADMVFPIVVTIGWVILGAILFKIIFKRKGFDN